MNMLLIESDKYLTKSVISNFKNTNVKITHHENTLAITDEFYLNDICVLDTAIYNDTNQVLEMIQYVKHLNKNISILVSIENVNKEDIVRYFSAGCIDYIRKPYHIKELEVRINKALYFNRKL